jgi:hypothetical protein
VVEAGGPIHARFETMMSGRLSGTISSRTCSLVQRRPQLVIALAPHHLRDEKGHLQALGAASVLDGDATQAGALTLGTAGLERSGQEGGQDRPVMEVTKWIVNGPWL